MVPILVWTARAQAYAVYDECARWHRGVSDDLYASLSDDANWGAVQGVREVMPGTWREGRLPEHNMSRLMTFDLCLA